VDIASILAPPKVGRVLLLNVVNPLGTLHGDPIDNAQEAVGEALRASIAAGHSTQALLSVSSAPWHEIRRVARDYRCYSILLGAPSLTEERVGELEELINSVESSVSFLFAHNDWTLARVRRIVVPVGGRGSHHALRARVLGGLLRTTPNATVFWLRALTLDATEAQMRNAERELRVLSTDVAPERSQHYTGRTADPTDFLVNALEETDLIVLGLAAKGGRHVFGTLLPRIIQQSPCPCLVIARGDEGERLGALVRQTTTRLMGPDWGSEPAGER
jgi:nucleotide-binding universal stress UspA family protein